MAMYSLVYFNEIIYTSWLRSFTKRIKSGFLGTYITQQQEYDMTNDEHIKSEAKTKMLIYYSFGGQKSRKKCQILIWSIPNIFNLVHFDLWGKRKFYFAIAFIWFQDSLI